jgi:hypothetical protein
MKKYLQCDLTLSSMSAKKELQLVHVDSKSSIQFACNFFGSTFGIGIHNRALNKGGSQLACIVEML